LWGDQRPAQARARLRETLFALRRALAPAEQGLLQTDGNMVILTATAVRVDVAEFERLVRERTPTALEQAATEYRGEFLRGLPHQTPDFEDWLMVERERLRELAIETLGRLVTHKRRAGQVEEALQIALRLVALDPLEEPIHRTLMRLYGDLGRRGMALRQYQTCVALLRREFNAEPEAETKQLYQDLVRGHLPRLAPAASPRRHSLRSEDPLVTFGFSGEDVAFVGRERELARVREALATAMGGCGQVVTLIGEAGIGKTSLLRIVAADARRQGMRLLAGRCHESDQILPFAPWAGALRVGQIVQDLDVLGALEPVWRAELSRLLPELSTTGVPAPSTDLNLFESVAQLVEQLALRCPLALILEDLHWADEMSLRLLAFISRRISVYRVFILTTAREEDLAGTRVEGWSVPDLSRAPLAVHVRLAPLSRPETHRLVASLNQVGVDEAGTRQLQEQVWTISEGNPFVAVEVTRAAQEGTVVPDGPAAVPARVKELITGRLGHLSDRGRQLAGVAAVIGREFDFSLLQRAARLDDVAAAEGVEELVRRRVLQGTGERFHFTHERIRAVAYSDLLLPQRRLLHRQVGEALESLHADHLGVHQLAVGMHYCEGELWEQAVISLRQAGTAAVKRSAYREAVVCLEQALGALGHLGESPETVAQAIDVRLDLRQLRHALGETKRMGDELEAALSLAEASRDDARIGRVQAHLSHHFWLAGQPHDAVVAGERAVSMSRRAGDDYTELVARFRVGLAYHELGDFGRAVEILRSTLASLRNPSIHQRVSLSVSARTWLAFSLAARGEFADAVVCGGEAIREAEALDDGWYLGHAYLSLGVSYLQQGELPDAVRLFEQNAKLVCGRGVLGLVASSTAWLGLAYSMSGRLAEGVRLLEDAVGKTESEGGPRLSGLMDRLRNEAWLLVGNTGPALEIARRGLARARNQQSHGNEAWFSWQLARIAAAQEPLDFEHTEGRYYEALTFAHRLGMRPLVAHCHLGLGTLYRRTSKREQAQEHLTTATTMYREMDMRFWLEQAAAEMRELA